MQHIIAICAHLQSELIVSHAKPPWVTMRVILVKQAMWSVQWAQNEHKMGSEELARERDEVVMMLAMSV